MSLWAATVITNFISTIPVVGDVILKWVWGSYSIQEYTLYRVFTLHVILPFVLLAVVGFHLYLLHCVGSSNPVEASKGGSKGALIPDWAVKDIHSIVITFTVFMFVVNFHPDMLGHPDNYIPANPLKTPPHIVPEWYFLPFYAILRSIPNKLLGVIHMVYAIVLLAVLPFVSRKKYKSSGGNEFFHKVLVLLWIIDFLLLGWIGANPAEPPYIGLGRLLTLGYFISLYFIVLL